MNTIAMPQSLPGLAKRIEMFVLFCYYDPAGISTVPENVAFLQRFSDFPISVVNMFEHRHEDGSLGLSCWFNLERFDGVILHNSISYNVDNLRLLDKFLRTPLRKFVGVKVLMKQDENYRFKELAQYVGETGFDLVFTCLPEDEVEVVYPKSVVGSVRFSRMLTGYVTPTLRAVSSFRERDIDIGYRGSVQPLSFGRLAYEKRKIGEDLNRLLDNKGLRLDVSSRWEDRLGSDSWLEFLCRSKVTLGVESGASIFDLDGDLRERIERIESKLGPYRDEAEYAEQFLAQLSDIEGKIYYNQISPRHFEAAACRTLQIMFPGEYSGIFKSGQHFIELARDYSNIEEVLAVLRDDQKRKEIVDRAYEEIVNNQSNWIETFVKGFDELVARVLAEKARASRLRFFSEKKQRNVLLLCAHKPSLDPRLDWISKYAPASLNVIQIGVLPIGSPDSLVTVLEDGRLVLAESRMKFDPVQFREWHGLASKHPASWAALSELVHINHLLGLSHREFLSMLAAPDAPARLGDFRWYLQYMLDTAMTLMSQALAIRSFGMIIATDLDALPAALLLKGMFGVPVIYDAHEYWPEADVRSLEFEKEFWIAMERRLVVMADHRQTVSTGLAALCNRNYGATFAVVPNCEPRSQEPPEPESKGDRTNGEVHFLFQGNFAPKRGIDILINAWRRVDQRAILLLRGPDNETKSGMIELAKQTGLFGSRIFFPAPVTERELVSSAKLADVGVIPYTPAGANYTNCCPNKMSQYMAASLSILANNTRFVSEIVEEAGAGIVVDFGNEEALVNAVRELVVNVGSRQEMATKGHRYFIQEFHWQRAARPMYAMMEDLVNGKQPTGLRVYERKPFQPLYFTDVEVVATSGVQRNSREVVDEIVSPPAAKLAPIAEERVSLTRAIWHKTPSPLRKLLMPLALVANRRR